MAFQSGLFCLTLRKGPPVYVVLEGITPLAATKYVLVANKNYAAGVACLLYLLGNARASYNKSINYCRVSVDLSSIPWIKQTDE